MANIQDLVELCSRSFSSLNIPEDIKGYDYAKRVVELAAEATSGSSDVKKGDALKELKVDLTCSACGKEGAIKMRRQLRSGDQGENVVIMCPNCGIIGECRLSANTIWNRSHIQGTLIGSVRTSPHILFYMFDVSVKERRIPRKNDDARRTSSSKKERLEL